MFNHPEYGDSDYMLTGNVPSEYKKIILNMIAEIRQIAVETTLIAISMKNDGIAVRKVLNGIVSKMAIIAKKHHKIEGGGEVVAYPMKAVDDAIMQLRKLVNTYKGVNSSKDFRFGQVQTQIQELTLEIMEYVDRKMDPRSELQPDWLVKINQKLTRTSEEETRKHIWWEENYIRKQTAINNALESFSSINALKKLLKRLKPDDSKR